MFQGGRFRKKTIFPHRYSKIFQDFWWSHTALWNAWLSRLKNEKDCLILITGDTGAGKSHLTGNFCLKHAIKEENFILKDGSPMFNPKENFIIDPEEFAYKMITKEGQVLWGDEFRRGSNRRSWYSPINKAIVDRKNTNRKLFNIYFLCLPFEKEFDPSLASHLTTWIWVRRGVGEIYCKMSGIKGGTGLNIQAILDREEKYLKENPKRTMVNPTIHPEYIGRIAFSKLTAGLERQYKELVKEKKATGDLSDEEKAKYGIKVEKKPKQMVIEAIENIKNGKIRDKKSLWLSLDEAKIDDDKKLKLLNFYLKLEGWDTFNKLFDKKKIETKDIW
jgi:energy-coupling factor transporter ATP-binding protein EcfA2